jgi:methionyl aminopeptidase
LREGDIINVDVTVIFEQWFGDTSKTYFVGTNIPEDRKHVTQVAFESLAIALAVVSHGARMGDIGCAIQQYAEAQSCGVVRDFTGHGIGKVFQDPEVCVPHFGTKGTGMKLVRGLTFTIEPMINGGTWRHRILSDGWTAVTADGKASAQFEHTLAIVKDGIDVLTALPDDAIVARARALGAKIYTDFCEV